MSDDVVFVYRSHYEGPLSKRVVRLPGASVLEWFQHAWREAQTLAGDVDTWLQSKLGTRVYGFATVFDKAREQALPVPAGQDELLAALKAHLYVEGEVRGGDGCLRVLTNDDEVELAWFMFTREWAAAHPEVSTWLLQEEWRLPVDAAAEGASFEPGFPITPVGPAGGGQGRVYLAFLTFADSVSLSDLRPRVIEGVRLPDLPGWLRWVVPEPGHDGPWELRWPHELTALRAALAPGELVLDEALRRVDGLRIDHVYGRGLEAPYETARRIFHEHPLGYATGSSDRSLVAVSPHLAQMCTHATAAFGYQQWFLFDDQWAAAHPDLARSLLRYAWRWDPWVMPAPVVAKAEPARATRARPKKKKKKKKKIEAKAKAREEKSKKKKKKKSPKRKTRGR